MNSLDQMSEQARAALAALSEAKASKKSAVAKGGSRIAHRNEVAKPIIAHVFEPIEAGEAPEGCNTKEAVNHPTI